MEVIKIAIRKKDIILRQQDIAADNTLVYHLLATTKWKKAHTSVCIFLPADFYNGFLQMWPKHTSELKELKGMIVNQWL